MKWTLIALMMAVGSISCKTAPRQLVERSKQINPAWLDHKKVGKFVTSSNKVSYIYQKIDCDIVTECLELSSSEGNENFRDYVQNMIEKSLQEEIQALEAKRRVELSSLIRETLEENLSFDDMYFEAYQVASVPGSEVRYEMYVWYRLDKSKWLDLRARLSELVKKKSPVLTSIVSQLDESFL